MFHTTLPAIQIQEDRVGTDERGRGRVGNAGGASAECSGDRARNKNNKGTKGKKTNTGIKECAVGVCIGKAGHGTIGNEVHDMQVTIRNTCSY